MPFTFSHPALVLPFYKKENKYTSIDMTGLVLGSMAPDMEYYILNLPTTTMGHTIYGFLTLNLFLCIIWAYIFHFIIKKPFISNMPTPFDIWLYPIYKSKFKLNGIKQLIIFIYSAIIGMVTHIFIDGFTHSNTFFTRTIPILRENINFSGNIMPNYYFLQIMTSIIGLILIVLFLYNNRNKIIPTEKFYLVPLKEKLKFYLSILVLTIIFIIINPYMYLGYLSVYVMGSIRAFLMSIIATSFIFRKNIMDLK